MGVFIHFWNQQVQPHLLVLVRPHFDPSDATYGPITKKIIFKMLMNSREIYVTFFDFSGQIAKKIGKYIVFPIFSRFKT